MSNVLTIIKKELTRFFTDKRLVLTTILLPGIMIYLIYSFLGTGLETVMHEEEGVTADIYAYNMPNSIQQTVDSLNIEVLDNQNVTIQQAKEEVEQKQVDLAIIFDENFDVLVENYDVNDGTQTAPNVQLFYNSTNSESSATYNMFIELLNNYEETIANKFDINEANQTYNLATNEDITASFLAGLLPLLLLIFIYSGCVAVAPESIAGEKERGTFATLLITPISRSQIAVGKVLSLSVIALLSGIASFLGAILSLPKLMAGALDNVSGSVYASADYLMLLGIILSTVLIIISVISIISAFAKNIKEAQTLVVPLMVVIMLIGASAMFTGSAINNSMVYLIPLFNSVQAMTSIFSFDANIINITITIASNIIYSGLLVLVLTRMFNSEKVMFNK